MPADGADRRAGAHPARLRRPRDASRAFDPSSAAAAETLRRAAAAGIDLASVTTQLEHEGVRSFCDSYRDLLACIETKLQRTAEYPARLAERADRDTPRDAAQTPWL